MTDDHEALTFHPLPDTKATNPKDAIGIRKAPLSTVPMGVIVEMGVGMLEGAAKYGATTTAAPASVSRSISTPRCATSSPIGKARTWTPTRACRT
jgi:hypothetical protein